MTEAQAAQIIALLQPLQWLASVDFQSMLLSFFVFIAFMAGFGQGAQVANRGF